MSVMRKFILAWVVVFGSQLALSLPSLGVSEILVTSNKVPNFINLESSLKVDSNNQKQLINECPNFSAQVKGKIIESGMFVVTDINNNLANYYLHKAEPAESPIRINDLESSIAIQTKSNLPDYLLIGKLAAASSNSDVNPINGTGKYTNTFSLDIAVDYQLIRSKDKVIVASFTAAGHAGDVRILDTKDQVVSHKMSNLISEVGETLAQDVNAQLGNQIGGGKVYLNSATSKTVTDYKEYSN